MECVYVYMDYTGLDRGIPGERNKKMESAVLFGV